MDLTIYGGKVHCSIQRKAELLRKGMLIVRQAFEEETKYS